MCGDMSRPLLSLALAHFALSWAYFEGLDEPVHMGSIGDRSRNQLTSSVDT